MKPHDIEIRVEVTAAEADFRSAVQHAINAGEKLTEAKGLVNHGEWLPWLEANFAGSERTASNYMRLAANQQRVAADLPTVCDALGLLAQRTAVMNRIEEAEQQAANTSGLEQLHALERVIELSGEAIAAARATKAKLGAAAREEFMAADRRRP